MRSPHRRPLIALLVLGVGLSAFRIFASDKQKNWLYSGLRALRDEPMGVGGWLVVIAVISTIVLAFVDTSHTARWLNARFQAPTARDLNDLKNALATSKRESREQVWLVNWGTRPPQLPEASEDDKAKVRTEIARLETPLKALSQALGGSTHSENGIINDITDGFRQGSAGRDLSFHFAPFFYHQVGGPTVRLLALLRSPGDEDPRQVFMAFFDQYKTFREWPAKAARFQSRRLGSYPRYEAWRKADAQMFTQFDNIPNEGECARLRKFVADYQRDEQYPGPLTDPEDELRWEAEEKATKGRLAKEAEEARQRRIAEANAEAARYNAATRLSAPPPPPLPDTGPFAPPKPDPEEPTK